MRRNRKEDGTFEVEEIVIDRRCDAPMAEKKHLLPCNEKCLTCLACLEQIESGEWRHFDPRRSRERSQA